MNETKKSTTLQSVKAVAVLVVICLVCVALLALCNDVFYISEEERARRQELKINASLVEVYPQFVQDTSFDGTLDSEFASNPSYGTVSKVVKSTDGTFIIAASDSGVGYGKTPITVLVAISPEAEIVAWKISDGGAETQLDNLKNANSTWYIGESISSGFAEMKVAGTTKSSDAVYNAIQMACFYAMNALHLGDNPEADAKTAVTELLESNGITGVELVTVANLLGATVKQGTTVADYLSDGTDRISFVFSGQNNGSAIDAYVYGGEESKIVVVAGDNVLTSSNVTESDAIYSKAINFAYVSVQFVSVDFNVAIVDVATEGDSVVYTALGFSAKGYIPGNYALKVTVKNQGGVGAVETVEVLLSGYAAYSNPETDANVLALGGLVGATSATVEDSYSANKVSGVTQSANIITATVKAVLAQFDANLAD